MKIIDVIIMGFGDRGQIYASYAQKQPQLMRIVGVVEPNDLRREKAAKLYNLNADMCFSDPEAFFALPKLCDAVINATMDSIHYKTTVPLLQKGYNVLLEKPVTANPGELLHLRDLARRHNVVLMVCHVLRYAPFYQRIKELLRARSIGAIINLHLSEHVAIPHMLSSYVRGKWNSERKSGSGMLMAKCCHDIDLMVWLLDSRPKQVSSMGGRSVFTAKKKPGGAADRCLDCRYMEACIYSAKKLYIDNDAFPFLVWQDVPGKDWDSVSKEQRIQLLSTVNPHGECAYQDNDLVDHQSVTAVFENGEIATLNMVGGASKAGRYIHIVGTHGEIEGNLESDFFTLRKFDAAALQPAEQTIRITEDVSGAHSGGDLRLAADFISVLRGDGRSVSCTDIDDSVTGHLLAIGAEKSRKENVFVNYDEFERPKVKRGK